MLFVDGIKVNDPASGDTPRFELLNADLASRIEIVRGPQSALWGSDAIGGVIAVNGLDEAPGYAARAEGGSFGFRRASASGALVTDEPASAAVGFQRATGIDSFGGRRRQGRLSQPVGPAARYVAPSDRQSSSAPAALALTGRSEVRWLRSVHGCP